MKAMTIAFLQKIGVAPSLFSDGMLNFEIRRLATGNLREKGFSEKAIRGIMADVTKIMNQVELESVDSVTAADGAAETLKTLKAKGLKIGVITNGCREYAGKVLSNLGLDKYVDAVAARDDVENPKPEPEHAYYLLRLLGTSADETLYVGDHWLDAECARRAGLAFVLIARRRQTIEALKDYQLQTVNRIKDIAELVNCQANRSWRYEEF